MANNKFWCITIFVFLLFAGLLCALFLIPWDKWFHQLEPHKPYIELIGVLIILALMLILLIVSNCYSNKKASAITDNEHYGPVSSADPEGNIEMITSLNDTLAAKDDVISRQIETILQQKEREQDLLAAQQNTEQQLHEALSLAEQWKTKHETAVQRIQQQLHEATDRNDRMETELAANRETLDRLQTENERIQHMLTASNEDNESKQQEQRHEIQTKHEMILHLQSENERIQRSFTAIKQENENKQLQQRQEIQTKEQTIADLQAEIKKLREEKARQVAEYDDDQKQPDDQVKGKEIRQKRFEEWLCATVELPQYLSLFVKTSHNDTRLIEFLSEEVIQNEIGIEKTVHCGLILKEARKYKALQEEFARHVNENKLSEELKRYASVFERNGILTRDEFEKHVQTKRQFGIMLKVNDQDRLNHLWFAMNPENDDEADVDVGPEGMTLRF